MHYDVIIAGAGLSGLSAGIRLAHYGRKVRIFESHTLPGGLNSYYKRRGHYIDVGLHAMTNYVTEEKRGAPLNKLLRQLRLKRRDLELCPQGYSLISFPGAELRLDNDFESFKTQVKELFPGDSDGFEQLCKRISEEDSLSLVSDNISARKVLEEYIESSLLREMLCCPVMYYGNAREGDMDFKQFCVMFQSVIAEGFARPKAGMKPFISMLAEQFKSCGGELSLGCGIKSFNCADGKVTGITDSNGENHTADYYISSAGAAETAMLCNNTQPLLQNAGTGSMGFIETVFQLDRHPRELGLGASIIFRNSLEKFSFKVPENGTDYSSQVICMPGNFMDCDELDCAEYVRVTALAAPDYWLGMNDTDYTAAKEETSAKLLEVLETMAPGISSCVVHKEMFTPKTIRRFTGHVNGAIYGAPVKNYTGETDCSNLFICGTDQGFLGIVGSMLSGCVIANRYGLS